MSNKSKLTLIIDGNWLLMSRMAVMNPRQAALNSNFPKDLKLLMIRSINIVLKQFPDIDNIIFMADGGSWRNNLEIPAFISEEYKGNRERPDDIDWDMIWGAYEDFMNTLRETGINTCREQGVEGDDWAWYWSTMLNEQGTNCIIWTKDKDLSQLVRTNKEGVFTAWWNKDNGIIIEDKGENNLDFFFNYQYDENAELLNNICSKSSKTTKLNPKTIIIDKIVRGDAGDNIMPIILKKSNSNPNKFFRVATKDLDFDIDIHNQESIRNYITNLLTKKSYAGKVSKTIEEIVDHFNYNVKLVTLEKESYPEEILEKLNCYTAHTCNKDITLAESKITAQANDLNDILETI